MLDEVGLPAWYWWGLAIGWVGLGVIADVGPSWLTTVATLLFGAVHSSVAPRVVDGRNRTPSCASGGSWRAGTPPRSCSAAWSRWRAFTVAGALVLNADGARHPATITSVFVAILIVLGGPQLLRRALGPR